MRQINSKTGLFCVIGDPIEHSLSPIMHNSVFEKLNLNYVYLAFKIKKEELEDAVKAFRILAHGFNVTIPHKVSIINYLDEISKEAELIGAVNTVKVYKNKLIGYNTDGIGAIKALEEKTSIEGKKIVVAGAGGASRAIVFQLALRDCEITLVNRTYKKAVYLAKEVDEKLNKKIKTEELSKLKEIIKNADIFINTTSVGMYPNTNETLLLAEDIPEKIVVMDIVYNPLKTRLLKEAEKAGAKTIDGLGMFVYQGAEALRIWLGIEPPVDVMRNAVLKALVSS